MYACIHVSLSIYLLSPFSLFQVLEKLRSAPPQVQLYILRGMGERLPDSAWRSFLQGTPRGIASNNATTTTAAAGETYLQAPCGIGNNTTGATAANTGWAANTGGSPGVGFGATGQAGEQNAGGGGYATGGGDAYVGGFASLAPEVQVRL